MPQYESDDLRFPDPMRFPDDESDPEAYDVPPEMRGRVYKARKVSPPKKRPGLLSTPRAAAKSPRVLPPGTSRSGVLPPEPEANDYPAHFPRDFEGKPLTGVDLFRQHFAIHQEGPALGDARTGQLHTDTMMLPTGEPDYPSRNEVVGGLPKARTRSSQLPLMQNPAGRMVPAKFADKRAVDAALQAPIRPGGETRRWTDDTGQYSVEGRLVRTEPNAIVIDRADGRRVRVPMNRLSPADVKHVMAADAPPQPVAQPQAPQPAGRRQAPVAPAAQPGPQGRPRMVDMSDEELRDQVHEEVEDGLEAARAQHAEQQQAVDAAPRPRTQEEEDDDRMARDWRDFRARGPGVDFHNERESHETSNEGALSAHEARRAANSRRVDEAVARSVARDNAERAARPPMDPARRDELIANRKRRENQAAINEIRRTYGDKWLAAHGYGPVELAQFANDGPEGIGRLRSDIRAIVEGNAAQQVHARNRQRAQVNAMREGRGGVILQDTMIAGGDREAAPFAAIDPVLAGNIRVNQIAAGANQPPAQPTPIGQVDALFGPQGVVTRIRDTVPPEQRGAALRAVLGPMGVPEDQIQAIEDSITPRPRGFWNWFGSSSPARQGQSNASAVGAATGYLDPQSVALGMRGPRVLTGLA